MSSFQNKIRICRLQSEWPEKTEIELGSMSFDNLTDDEIIKNHYLPIFFKHSKCWLILGNHTSIIQNAALSINIDPYSTNPEEDFLLKLYKVWLIGLIICRYKNPLSYEVYASSSIKEIERLYDRMVNQLKEEKDQQPFWKFW